MDSLFHHLFLPRPSNNHKPRLLHHSSFLCYILLFVTIQIIFTMVMSVSPQILGLATNINVTDLLDGVNKKRTENGMNTLQLDADLSKAAYDKAQDMFSKSYWAHFAPDGTTPWFFIEQAGYKYKYAGENLAKDFAVSDQVVTAWMNSETHKKNILDARFTDVGMAVVNGKLNGEETTLVVQMFGTRTKNIAQVSSNAIATQMPPAKINDILPSTTTASVSEVSKQTTTPNPVAGVASTSVVKAPSFNVFSLTKKISLALGIFLIALLYVDALFIFKKKIYRISGNNIAHMVFLLFLLAALYWTRYGTII